MSKEKNEILNLSDLGSQERTEEIIRMRAYQLFEERGYEHGHELDDWLQAEAEVARKKPVARIVAWEKVVTAYDSVDKAKNAVKVLENAGYNTSDLSIIDRTSLGSHGTDHVGLWRRLFGDNVWDHEAASVRRYAR